MNSVGKNNGNTGTREFPASRYLRLLGDAASSKSTNSHTLKSRGSGDKFGENTIALSEPKMEDRIRLLTERLEAAESERPKVFEHHKLSTKAIVDSAKNAWIKLNEEGNATQLTSNDAIGLEAIVEIDGSRPTLRFNEDGELIQEKNTTIADRWQFVVNNLKPEVEKVATKVCRIDLDGKHAGTGFSFGDHAILTNRHVLQAIASSDGNKGWKFKGDVTADFGSGIGGDMSKTFECVETGIITGPENINPFVIDFSKFDYALISCKLNKKSEFPIPLLPQKDAAHIMTSMSVYALGFPARPGDGQYSNALMNDLFGFDFGIKRFSPGEVDFGLGHETTDTYRTVFTYDSSTLPGSSGSPVLDISSMGVSTVGLHFAGWEKGNYAHSLAAGSFRGDLIERGITYPV